MKKSIIIFTVLLFSACFAFAQNTVDLKDVTFGVGIGPAYSFDQVYDYSLTTDAAHMLKLQPLSKGAFVISSVMIVKLKKLSVDPVRNNLVAQSKKTEYAKDSKTTTPSTAGFADRFSIIVGINLADISSNISFNKSINGGLGVGYFVADNLQVGLFWDISQVRQLRNYVVAAYQDKSIPNGDGTNYNALDPTDNNLFYNKTITGLSFKLIFSIAGKKN